MAVTGNDEGLAITRAQVKCFELMRKEPVLLWVCSVRIRKVGQKSGNAERKITYTRSGFGY